MDDLKFILPCGFTMQYDVLFSNEKAINVFLCPYCKSHYISTLECLELDRNKLALNENRLQSKKQHLKDSLEQIEEFKDIKQFVVDENFQILKNKVDLRREEIKIFLNKKIDDYYENLLLEIEKERNSSLAKINKELERISLFETETNDAEVVDNLDTKSIIELVKKNEEKVVSQINVVNSVLKNLSGANLAFERGEEDLDVEQFFGNLILRKEKKKSSPIKNPVQISFEQSLNFVVRNFSKLEKLQKIELKTKPFLIPNFEWSVFIELNQDALLMGIYLKSNSVEYKDRGSVNIQAIMRLLHLRDSKYDYDASFNRCINQNEISSICLNFFKFKKIIDPKNGYYNIEDDSIKFEASINTNSAWNLNRNYYNNNYHSDTDYDS